MLPDEVYHVGYKLLIWAVSSSLLHEEFIINLGQNLSVIDNHLLPCIQ